MLVWEIINYIFIPNVMIMLKVKKQKLFKEALKNKLKNFFKEALKKFKKK